VVAVDLASELTKCQHRRDPPVPVIVRRPLDDEEWPGLLHVWSDSPDGRRGGLRGLTTYQRDIGSGYVQDVVSWTLAQNISQA
jgi:hypothetical protein